MSDALYVGAKVRAVTAVAILFFVAVGVYLYTMGGSTGVIHVRSILSLFEGIVWDSLPFLVIGVTLSSVVDVLSARRAFSSLLSTRIKSHALAATLGLALPVCDCGVAPVARTMRRRGVPEATAMTFALATPTLNIISIAATFVAFHGSWSMVLWRVGAVLLLSLSIGVLLSRLQGDATDVYQQSSVRVEPARKTLATAEHMTRHAIGELVAIGPFLILSALIAATAQELWPLRAVTAFTQHSLWSIPLMMALGGMLSLCSEADAFVAAGLASLFSPGAILAFLLAGQLVDIRNMMVFPSVFQQRTIWTALPLAALFVFVISVMANYFFLGRWTL
ncbi:permease [Ferroacidibacillus organovorans]|uniref:Permease n=1 Tax=Ferroacidibacillus organovorans TaxID=1765683 RepID=A0A161QGI6_9BACL|nr:permease [Ferroacidibacillus organovorans]KYP81210.1 hypothetical protein AYJ22_08230 [Ferroacidibacillus organovorans]OAG93909.1 hypothetical protein AYW79_08200 [Ferroacidibacillus organovorans]OPG17705.1 hypothetical protein B2M26_00735 [Ferroacidibacillus organovorans]